MRISIFLFVGFFGLAGLSSSAFAQASWPTTGANGATPVQFTVEINSYEGLYALREDSNMYLKRFGLDNITDAAPLNLPLAYTQNMAQYTDFLLTDGNNPRSQTMTATSGGNLFVQWNSDAEFGTLLIDPLFSYALILPQTTGGQYISGIEYFGGDRNLFNGMTFAFDGAGKVTMKLNGTYTMPDNFLRPYFAANFTTAAVPEPATTVLLLSLGVGAFAVWRRRRR